MTAATPEETMTIRQMCDSFDVTARTLRFYEAKDLLRPIRIGTRRLFTRADRARLTLILRAKRYGLSLEAIRQLLDLYDPATGNRAQIDRAVELGQERLAVMQAERDALDHAMTDLTTEIARVRALSPSKARSAA